MILIHCWIVLLHRGQFVWHWASQCTDTRAFYIVALSIIIFFLGFRQWRFRADRALTLNMNIWLPLFWSSWNQARGPALATCAGLAHGSDYSNCRASELKLPKCLTIVSPWIVENTSKQWPTVRVFQPSSTLLVLLTFQTICPDGSSFCPLSSSGQEKGYFGLGLVFFLFVYLHIPERGLW